MVINQFTSRGLTNCFKGVAVNTMEVKKAKKVTDKKFLNLFDIDYIDQSGNDKSWILATRADQPKCMTRDFNIPDAVVIAPFHVEKQKLVIIKEFRVALGGYQYGFPAGLVDKGEKVEESAARELKEETGLDITRFLKTGPPTYTSTGLTDESVSMLFAECAGDASTEGNESSEDIEVIFADRELAEKLINDFDAKTDVKTWIILYAFAKFGPDFFYSQDA